MPTDLEIIEAEEAGGKKPLPDGKAKLGLFMLFVLAFLILAGVSAIFINDSNFSPWVTLTNAETVGESKHPHLRGTVYRVDDPHDTVRDGIFKQLGFSPSTGLAFHSDLRVFGLLGGESRCKVPLAFGSTNSGTLLARSEGRHKSIVLLTAATTNSTRVLMIEHQPDPAKPYHVHHLKSHEHYHPSLTATMPAASGAAMGMIAVEHGTQDKLSDVIAYYLTTFSPEPPTASTHKPALLLSPGDSTNATHFTMFLQSDKGPKFIHAAEDLISKETKIIIIEFHR